MNHKEYLYYRVYLNKYVNYKGGDNFTTNLWYYEGNFKIGNKWDILSK